MRGAKDDAGDGAAPGDEALGLLREIREELTQLRRRVDTAGGQGDGES
jgi:hypothetical protein